MDEARTARLVADPYPPYQYVESGAVKGVDHDVVTAAFRASGVRSDVLILSWEECMKRVEEGRADGVFQIVKTPERERLLAYSHLLRTASSALYARKGSSLARGGVFDSAVPRPRMFDGLRLGLLDGYSYHPVIDALDPSLKVGYASHEALFEGLLRGDFDVALADRGVASHTLRSLRVVNVERVGTLEVRRELFAAFRREREELRRLFNDGLAAVRKSGAYEAAFSRYGVPP